jgi:hypothetical protein
MQPALFVEPEPVPRLPGPACAPRGRTSAKNLGSDSQFILPKVCPTTVASRCCGPHRGHWPQHVRLKGRPIGISKSRNLDLRTNADDDWRTHHLLTRSGIEPLTTKSGKMHVQMAMFALGGGLARCALPRGPPGDPAWHSLLSQSASQNGYQRRLQGVAVRGLADVCSFVVDADDRQPLFEQGRLVQCVVVQRGASR